MPFNDSQQLPYVHHQMFIRTVQLAMNIFNLSNSNVIFDHKLLCLLAGIVGMYFLVRLVFLQPLVTLMFVVLLFNAVTFYSVMWGNVFVIPETTNRLRKGLIRNGRLEERCFTRGFIKSVPCMAVKVGKFRSMERNSTLLFLDFVTGNTAAMLISF